MKDSWCRNSGGNAWGVNPAKAQQMRQMLEKYLAESFPEAKDQERHSLKSRVKWSGKVLEEVTFHSKNPKDLEKIQTQILKQTAPAPLSNQERRLQKIIMSISR